MTAWTRIRTYDDYLQKCADRYFGEDEGQSIATSDGHIMGDFGGQQLRGTWEWQDEFFARTSTIGDIDLGFDRIVIDISDSQMRLTLEEGSGPEVIYDAKPPPPQDIGAPDETTVCSTFRINPDGVDRYVAAMVENQQAVRAEAGNLEMRLFQAVADPTVFFVFGRTGGAAADTEHAESVKDRGIEEMVAPTLAEPPVVHELALTAQGATYGPRERPVGADELIVMALFDFKPGTRDSVLAQYDKQIPLVREDSGNLVFNAYTVNGQPDQLLVYERWRSQAHAADFSTNRPVSVETGQLLAASVVGELPAYIQQVREIAPYE